MLIRMLQIHGTPSLQSSSHLKPCITFVDQSTERTYSRQEVYQKVLQYAEASKKLPNGLHLIIHKTSPEAMFSFLGTMAAGNQPAMISPPAKEPPADYDKKIKGIISTVKPAAIVTDAAIGPILHMTPLEIPMSFGPEEKIPKHLDYREEDDFGFVQFSSGSTGLQKGVEIFPTKFQNHNAAYRKKMNFTTESKIFSWLPLYHDMGLITSFLMPLSEGIPIVFMSPFHWVADPKVMLQTITKHKCTHIWMPNFAFKLMADRVKPEGNLSSVEMIVNCSEPCYADHMRAFYEKFKSIGLKKEAITTCYAMAESVFAISQGIGENFEPITEPLEGVNIKIASDGEIWIYSPFSLLAYYGQDSIIDNDLYYPTGDLGTFENGKLTIKGRKKDMMIIDGKNIYPNDVETLVNDCTNVHPGRCVVFGEYMQAKGTEIAVVLFEPDSWETKEETERLIKQKIASTFDLSVNVLAVPTNWLRKTSSGKISRTFNREKYQKHREYVSDIVTIICNVLRQSGKDETIGPNTKLVSTGILASIDMMEVTLDLEAKTGIGMGGAYSIYGAKNESAHDLAFFIESKVYGKPGI